MAGLLYYLPGRNQVRLQDLPELGLAHAFERDCTACQIIGRGPDGSQGVVFADSGRVKRIAYYPSDQQWEKIPGHSAGAWIGRSAKEPVTPADLQRLETLPGHSVRLADGQEWQVPVARGWAEEDGAVAGWYVAVPKKATLDDEGNWTQGEVSDRYASLWKTACEWWDAIFAAGEQESGVRGQESGRRIEFDFPRLNDAGCEVLAVNYRVSRVEVSLLGLFEDGTARDVLMAAIDWPTLERIIARREEKKTDEISAAAGSSSASGPPAD